VANSTVNVTNLECPSFWWWGSFCPTLENYTTLFEENVTQSGTFGIFFVARNSSGFIRMRWLAITLNNPMEIQQMQTDQLLLLSDPSMPPWTPVVLTSEAGVLVNEILSRRFLFFQFAPPVLFSDPLQLGVNESFCPGIFNRSYGRFCSYLVERKISRLFRGQREEVSLSSVGAGPDKFVLSTLQYENQAPAPPGATLLISLACWNSAAASAPRDLATLFVCNLTYSFPDTAFLSSNTSLMVPAAGFSAAMMGNSGASAEQLPVTYVPPTVPPPGWTVSRLPVFVDRPGMYTLGLAATILGSSIAGTGLNIGTLPSASSPPPTATPQAGSPSSLSSGFVLESSPPSRDAVSAVYGAGSGGSSRTTLVIAGAAVLGGILLLVALAGFMVFVCPRLIPRKALDSTEESEGSFSLMTRSSMTGEG
jgi:hypothetical protein